MHQNLKDKQSWSNSMKKSFIEVMNSWKFCTTLQRFMWTGKALTEKPNLEINLFAINDRKVKLVCYFNPRIAASTLDQTIHYEFFPKLRSYADARFDSYPGLFSCLRVGFASRSTSLNFFPNFDFKFNDTQRKINGGMQRFDLTVVRMSILSTLNMIARSSHLKILKKSCCFKAILRPT